MTTIHEIQAWAAPILAPAAPATLLGNSLYQGMVADNVPVLLAGFVAVGAAIGTEFTGAIAARAGVEAYRKQKPVHMWLAVGSALVYAVFVFFGISAGAHTKAFGASVLVSLIAYLGVAIYNDLRESDNERAKETELLVKETEAQARLINAQKNMQNALNRGAKVSSGGVQVSKRPSGHVDTPEAVKVRAAWKANPGASQREIARICEVSPMTAGKYKPESEQVSK